MTSQRMIRRLICLVTTMALVLTSMPCQAMSEQVLAQQAEEAQAAVEPVVEPVVETADETPAATTTEAPAKLTVTYLVDGQERVRDVITLAGDAQTYTTPPAPDVGDGRTFVAWCTTPTYDESSTLVPAECAMEDLAWQEGVPGHEDDVLVTHSLLDLATNGQITLHAYMTGATDAHDGETLVTEVGETPETPETTGATNVCELDAKADDMSVTARIETSAPLGEDVTLKVSDLRQSVTSAPGQDQRFCLARTMDISLERGDGSTIELGDDARITLSFTFEQAPEGFDEVSVVHGQGEGAEVLPTEVSKDTVTATSDGFSPYTVEFYYQSLRYVMEGHASIPLKDILAELGIAGMPASVDDVQVSDASLFDVTDSSDGLTFNAKEPFDTDEWMRLSIDGAEYFVVLEDASFVAGGSFAEHAYWWLDSDGVLRIRPLSAYSYATLTEDYTATSWPWYSKRDSITSVVIQSEIRTTKKYSLESMFESYPNLESADLSGLDTAQVTNARKMFQSCPKLTDVTFPVAAFPRLQDAYSMFRSCTAMRTLDLSRWTNDGRIYNMSYLCASCTSLETFVLNNPDFVTRTNDGCLLTKMFDEANMLKTVDMSNITIGGRSSGTDSMDALFCNRTRLETVSLRNAKFPGVRSFNSCFQWCDSLRSVDLTGCSVEDAQSMDRMFYKCVSLGTLDVSSFGRLKHIQDMYGFVYGCTQLKTLDISGLDNSNIPDDYLTENPRLGYSGDEDETVRYFRRNNSPDSERRDLGLSSCTSLERLVATGSNVWICAETTSVYGGDTYWDVSDGHTYSRIMGDRMYYSPDIAPEDSILLNLREWCDLVTDRYLTDTPDAATNPNMRYGQHTNTCGEGHLSPGVYTRTTDEITYFDTLPTSTYWIDRFETAVPTVEFEVDGQWVASPSSSYLGEVGDYLVTANGSSTKVYTRLQNIGEWGTGDHAYQGGRIRITFPDAATAPDGTRRNIIVTMKGFTFKDVELVPNAGTYVRRKNDQNIVVDQSYYRYLLNIDTGLLELRNYVIDDQGHFALSGGSGTYTDYAIEIEGAKPGETYVFWGKDVDVMHAQNWIRHPTDALYDQLPFENVTYGAGSEGVILKEGNHLDTLTLASHTGLEVLNGNYVVPTGSDPSTPWSDFFVKSDATGSSYTWTSGTACTSRLMLNSGGGELPTTVTVRKRTTQTTDRSFSFTGAVYDASGEKVRDVSFDLQDGQSFEVKDLYRQQRLVLDETPATGWQCLSGSHVEHVVDGESDITIEYVNGAASTPSYEFRKADANSLKLIAGAKLSIVDAESEDVVESWTSLTAAHVTQLADGSYLLRETEPPEGYMAAEDIAFTIRDGSIVTDGVDVGNSLTMYDSPAKVSVNLRKQTASGDGRFDFVVRATAPGFVLDLSDCDFAELESATQNTWRVHLDTTGGTAEVHLFDMPYGGYYHISEVIDEDDWKLVSVDGDKNAKVVSKRATADVTHVFVNRKTLITMPSAGSRLDLAGFVGVALIAGILVHHALTQKRRLT